MLRNDTEENYHTPSYSSSSCDTIVKVEAKVEKVDRGVRGHAISKAKQSPTTKSEHKSDRRKVDKK